MDLIAARIYELDDVLSEERLCIDRLFKCGRSYALRMVGGGKPERWQVMTEANAVQWMSEAPEQLHVFS